ncbi:MAG: glycosyltransferase [Elainellaceae cyanobacterium]
MISAIAIGFSALSCLIWVYLLLFRGQFWRTDQHLEAMAEPSQIEPESGQEYPAIHVVIPARDEADSIATTVRSLLNQDYPGSLSILLVDDHSTDGTRDVAAGAAQGLMSSERATRSFEVLQAQPLPPGWTGKLWALDQGTRAVLGRSPQPQFILLSDADIAHDPQNLSRLVAKAQQDSLDLASIMVKLRCESVWEQMLIPAFVFFFEKLYPFRWVNNPSRATAAAAGGCILIRSTALQRIGGIATLRDALIDDCTLAHQVKHSGFDKTQFRPIWLGLSSRTSSLRPYPDLKTVWDMVARTAYTQLNYSPLLLVGTLLGMALVYLVAPVGLIGGLIVGQPAIAILSLATWLMMAIAYWPILRFYRCSPLWAAGLPAIASLYTLMTLDSALRHWQGRGGQWKGRTYAAPPPAP